MLIHEFMTIFGCLLVCANAQIARIIAMEPNVADDIEDVHNLSPNNSTTKISAKLKIKGERRMDVPKVKLGPNKSYSVLDKRGNLHTHTFSEEHIHVNAPRTRKKSQKRSKGRSRKVVKYPRDFIEPPVPKYLRKAPPRFEDINNKNWRPKPKKHQQHMNKTLQDYLARPEDIMLTTSKPEHFYDITEKPIEDDDGYPYPLDGPIVLPQQFRLNPPVKLGDALTPPPRPKYHNKHNVKAQTFPDLHDPTLNYYKDFPSLQTDESKGVATLVRNTKKVIKTRTNINQEHTQSNKTYHEFSTTNKTEKGTPNLSNHKVADNHKGGSTRQNNRNAGVRLNQGAHNGTRSSARARGSVRFGG